MSIVPVPMKLQVDSVKHYCNSLTSYSRRITREVKVGGIGIGGENPIRVQSMTTIDTLDTLGSIEQTIRMVNAGCELVRITAPSLKEAQNLQLIKNGLRERGYDVPLIADIHFTPNAAELAAKIVEKVRINPGNYADKKKFEVLEYTDLTYQAELERIRERFTPLVKICKEHGTAMRIGTNHGSLSDRILGRYGDTPLGMVESALEFLRICEDMEYYDIVLSMKASNTQVMVQAYRLLVQKLEVEGFQPYPLHLGVTEAGEGEDGRIKSAVGIGALLEDGLGDTVRVSLTEEPEAEAPVARIMVDRYQERLDHAAIPAVKESPIDPFHYQRRKTTEVLNIGGSNVPRVIADIHQFNQPEYKDFKVIGHFYMPLLDKWKMNDLGADYIYSADNPVHFMLPNGLKEVLNYASWVKNQDRINKYPLLLKQEFLDVNQPHAQLNFLRLTLSDLSTQIIEKIKQDSTIVILLDTNNAHAMAEQRRFIFELIQHEVYAPVVVMRKYERLPEDKYQIFAATDVGSLLIDGLGDGIMLSTECWEAKSNESLAEDLKLINNTAFGILQAARTRMSKTEYISCPSCGRTLFDLQETTAMIRRRTDHLKGVKIGIMGCIVNGPGEMADADYGYVGSGKGKITLYKGQEVMKKSVSSEQAVDALINIIREDGRWTEPEAIE